MSDRLFHILFPSRAREINALTAELSSLREQLSAHLASIDRLTEERDHARTDAAEARRSENTTLQKLLSAERADHYRTDPFGYAPVAPDPEKKILPQIEHAREHRRDQRSRTRMRRPPRRPAPALPRRDPRAGVQRRRPRRSHGTGGRQGAVRATPGHRPRRPGVGGAVGQ